MDELLFFPFYKDGKPLQDCPAAGMTLRASGSMRFRWNEENPRREALLSEIAGSLSSVAQPVPLELCHSRIVCDVRSVTDTRNLKGDGMISVNPEVMPVVTVADCMPIYFYDSKKGVFGIVHSGWRGTGIIADALRLASERYGTCPSDVSVILGPHIRECCYIVDEERACFFEKSFGDGCASELEKGGRCLCGGRGLPVEWSNKKGRLFRLSLEKANLHLLKRLNVPEGNIYSSGECTCCGQKFGSNRRETAATGRPDAFTVMAAFIVRQAKAECFRAS